MKATPHNIVPIMKGAALLGLDLLSGLCANSIGPMVTLDGVCPVLEAAFQAQETDILEACKVRCLYLISGGVVTIYHPCLLPVLF